MSCGRGNGNIYSRNGNLDMTLSPKIILGRKHRCFTDGQYEQAIGIALEARRLDKLEEAVSRTPDTAATLVYALQVCQRMVINRDFRQQVGSPACRRFDSQICLPCACKGHVGAAARSAQDLSCLQSSLTSECRGWNAKGGLPAAYCTLPQLLRQNIQERQSTSREVQRCLSAQVLTLLVKLYEASAQPSWVNISQCLVFLDQPGEVANILHRLLRGSEVCSGIWLCFRLAFLLAFQHQLGCCCRSMVSGHMQAGCFTQWRTSEMGPNCCFLDCRRCCS